MIFLRPMRSERLPKYMKNGVASSRATHSTMLASHEVNFKHRLHEE